MKSSGVAKPLLVVLLGPTAVGKTGVAVQLAQRFGCDIVSADSRQVFRQLKIGVARPTDAELRAAKHHLVAHRDVWERYSCGQYAEEARGVLQSLFATQQIAILTGGSMLYISAVCDGLEDFPTPDMKLRAALTRRLREEGVEALAAELVRVDTGCSGVVDARNGARVLRALEVSLQTGRPYSEWLSHAKVSLPFDVLKVGLILPMEVLTARIGQRVDLMVAEGLEEEAQRVQQYKDTPALRTVGYRELFDYFEGRCTREAAIERIKVNTRRYAKRQMTWWKRENGIAWFFPYDVEAINEYVDRYIMSRSNENGGAR